ncbi:SRPBCC family protein [Saccharothrix sp. Mg75]|uniref:SRPBCC family protein n=1 Tax=Saccharothrix sp. Mg75 TaxID=3445357 RepID=UPI003EF05BCB
MSIHARRDIPALPDLVFNAAADPSRLASWLPGPHEVVGRTDDVLILRDGEGDGQRQVQLAVDYDQLLLTWEPLADEGCRGELRVSLAGAAGSVAELRVDDCADEQFAARFLEALADEVEQNLTAG